jgi:hypothetical protein
MHSSHYKITLRAAFLGICILLLAVQASLAQQQINLTAAPTTTTLPDGSSVPMWGYSCGATVSGSLATCAPLKVGSGWSPVVITVPAASGSNSLQVNLTNSLSFANGNTVPTSLVIVGQLGGGLGDVTQRVTTASPDHSQAQATTTWPIVGAGASATPPVQGRRVQSFSTEVTAGKTVPLTWNNLRPGTYLIESGTHPSIQGPMGLYGVLVVTTTPTTTAGVAYPASTAFPSGVAYDAEIPLLFSEIDPVQNRAVNTAVNTVGFSETRVWSGLAGGCGNPASGAVYNTCYPPAVNYSPLYFMINGTAFSRSNAAASLFPTAPATIPATPLTGLTNGRVLVRMVNAGLRMHVPAIVGSTTGTSSAAGFTLVAEDGNLLPGAARLQSEVFLAAGKTFDVMINGVAAGTPALPVFDRELSLSGNKVDRDAGMLAYVSINGGGLPAAPVLAAAVANPDVYNSVVPGQALTISDPNLGVIANDVNVYGVNVSAPAGCTVGVACTLPHGSLFLNADGTFTYTPDSSWSLSSGATTTDAFTYQANGTGPTALVTLNKAVIESGTGLSMGTATFTSNVATYISVAPPGVLTIATDGSGYPLVVDTTTISGMTLCSTNGSVAPCLEVQPNGGIQAMVPTHTGSATYSFTFKAKNSQGTQSASAGTINLVFPAPGNLAVSVVDATNKSITISDYRWIIEEDRSFYVDPKCTTNPPPTGCPSVVPTLGVNFHTSYMPVVAQGCTGTLSCGYGQSVLGAKAVCDVGNGICRTDATQRPIVLPSQAAIDPTKRYYISVLPGDAGNPFAAGYTSVPSCAANGAPNGTCGHGMGGAPIAVGQTSVTVLTEPSPYQPAKLSVFVFEDDFPLNGENDAGGGVDVLAPIEPGLGGFNITLFDDAGGTGDATGQMTYDMFNMPLSNALAGTPDPANNNIDACPISQNSRTAQGTASPTGITGTIVTCPKYEADGVTLSPLAGQAVVANLMPGRFGVVATPAADRIARGEEWLQTNTLDGQKAHDSFLRIGEPSYFQEFGPAGYHVSIGFANPKIINDRRASVCNGTNPYLSAGTCSNTVTGLVSTMRMSRTPDERLYPSGSNKSFAFTQCYVSLGDPDGMDFAFTKCNATGHFTLSGIPDGTWRVTIFDQWNDMLVDGLSTPVALTSGSNANPGCPGPSTSATVCDLGQVATNQWQSNVYTQTFLDLNGNGIRDASEPGLALVHTNVRFRDGSVSNRNRTDLDGVANFNEVFPLFNWYVVETDTTRYKSTGIHVVYDAGGPADGAGGGSSTIGQYLANTQEAIPLPTSLRVPGAYYCADADCTAAGSFSSGIPAGGPGGSTGRIDPSWVSTEGWQGFSGQNNFVEWGMKPFAVGENGGIRGKVVYASTRPFDDPTQLVQNTWEPLVPGVTVNLYQQGTAPDGTTSLKLVDTTTTSSWDAWAQGFRTDGNPNMNCPGQGRDTGTNADLFFFSIYNQPDFLDVYNNTHSGTTLHTVPYNSQFKCYDGMHNWNQLQPAPYDGLYQFPSVTGLNPTTGKPTGTNCTICTTNPDSTDAYRYGTPMLPTGNYVVEVVVPPGYELVKEEDKNILIGDNFIAPVTQEFASLSYVFILPDQASVAGSYNANNAQNPTQNLGFTPLADDGVTLEQLWPCVGQARIVPDYISLFPQSKLVSPFAGATRNLCDRKLVTLNDQTAASAGFYIYTSTHAASHFTGVITDDFTSEFDPFSPQFGEKFAPPDLPVSVKDFNGNETSRVYADHWGAFNGLTYSTWEVNPPNPTGYSPTMMITCMNDPGPIPNPASPGQMITDPLYNPAYSQFCYELSFMPGQTAYLDTPVVPVSAFAGSGYNNVDCSYPDATPAIAEVDGDGVGPWVSAAGHTLTITALGNQTVNNYAYSGPQATVLPFNQKTITRHYGFGSTAGTVALVGSDGVPHALTSVSWSDTTITGVVPSGVPNCVIQQQTQYSGGASSAQCGELVITAANGKQSIDTVTVTIGGKAPTHISASSTIQSAIDAASPGDLLIVDPTCSITTGTGSSATNTPAATCTTTGVNTKTAAAHNEMLLMWKPLRLQGVGAVTSVINANAQPAGKMDPWRRQVLCLFGIALNGQPITAASGSNPGNPFDSTGTYACSAAMQFQVDRLPLEGTVGWDATVNGNMAELLQEPTLMGAYEGAAITVLGKGVQFPAGGNPFSSNEGAFPTGTTLLTGAVSASGTMTTGDANALCHTSSSNTKNPYPSNFMCNPSRIDGLTISDSSQGGGGIFAHAWNHNLEIANNRVRSNTGTLAGGIAIGQGDFPGPYLGGADNVATNDVPGSCQTSSVENLQLPYCFNLHVNLHHNYIANNSSIGDELFSSTPSGPGGVAFCDGADYYKFNYNWVCGNFSSGDGGGMAHLGFSYNADIEHNSFLFNQSTNPTIPTNGGGLLIHGTPDVDPTCGTTTDQDCSTPGLSDGTGPNMVINANLFQGNAADSGSGGGIRFQGVNGSDVVNFPTQPSQWYSPLVTNNIITNNVAGWDGAGVSVQDALALRFINNTVMANDSTASSGVLMNTIGAPLGAYPGVPVSGQTTSTTTSAPQPAGLVAIPNSPQMLAALPATITCPAGFYAGSTANNGTCRRVSYPQLANNVFWQNRSFYIGVGPLGNGTINQQHVVVLYNAFQTTTAPTQPSTPATTTNGGGVIITGGTGACVSGVSYWDLGIRGDTSPSNHTFLGGIKLAPTYSVITDLSDYSTIYGGTSTAHNTGSNPTVLSQYCNGSRIAPENCATTNTPGCGLWNVPPGISDATVPNPIFSLMPAATVDEGNNWVNITWGPLALTNDSVTGGAYANYGGGSLLGNYGIAAGSPAINYIPSSATTNYSVAPSTDFYGNQRKTNNAVDAGAVEFVGTTGSAKLAVTPTSLAFGNVAVGSTPTLTLTLSNTGTATATAIAVGTFPTGFSRPTGTAGGTCGTTLAAGSTCTIIVRFAPTAGTTYSGSVAITGSVTVTGSPVSLSGTGTTQGQLTFALTGTVPSGVSLGNATINGVTRQSVLFGLQTGTAKTVSVSVTNTGGGAVIFTSATFTNTNTPTIFTQTNNCPIGGAGLAVGASCTLNITLTPPATTPGTNRISYYTFTDNGAGSPQVLGVTGR